ncbi:hypothetical protein PFLUV_G00079320 [Perca fluviatilis]|uniref:Uncharacterized protein n=1 Tax=Perca fluviatilis TaxID=8168 RepID=A0A6A5FAA8_PERFL|nr:hypothetical protein PFLUV_G00079320 [Perca fluviatilis]
MLQEAGVETPRTSSTLAPTAKAIIEQQRQKITALEDERNFLREQLKKALDKPPIAAGKHQSPSGSDSSDSYSLDSESSSSSSDRRKRKKKTKRKSIKKDKGAQFGKRKPQKMSNTGTWRSLKPSRRPEVSTEVVKNTTWIETPSPILL